MIAVLFFAAFPALSPKKLASQELRTISGLPLA
jgi:hypothetical protein